MKRYEDLYRTILLEHERVFAAQDRESIDTAMQEIVDAKRIFVIGAGREGIAARSFAMRLMHLGKEVHWLWDDTTPRSLYCRQWQRADWTHRLFVGSVAGNSCT